VPHTPQQNDLLAALPAAELLPLAIDLELVPMRLGDMIYEPGRPLRHAYFPTTAVVSLHHVTLSGATAETSGVGHEGVVGVSLFMGGDSVPSSAVVQTAGHAYRLGRLPLLQQFERSGTLRRSLLLYGQALITQIAQTAACYRHHTVDQQLSRWLLSTVDRTPSHDLVMTHALVASLLGVRRESVSEAAARLQLAGFIRYRRGHISVLDHAGLESCACECYAVVKRELGRLLQHAPRAPAEEHQHRDG